MNWNPVYAFLLLLSTAITYICGIFVEKTTEKKERRAFLIVSVILNFGILFVFKYYNFVNEATFDMLNILHIRWEIHKLNLLLPIGISFYTFQVVGYTIDVYRGDLKAEKNFGIYALFVSFFPKLLAGPIERAKNLLPQFYVKHDFDSQRTIQGLKLMLWGFFMKVVVSDRLAIYVNAVFDNVKQHNGTTLLLATCFFSFQIYGDFAGYSYLAIGSAKIMGFDLMTNFNHPYLSKSISEFWRRWHISLMTWFRDYLYIPLGGNKVPFGRWQKNILIIFLVSGIWHGANWTFIIWGGINGFYQILAKIKKKILVIFLNIDTNKEQNNFLFYKVLQIVLTFFLVSFAWIFFRANTMSDAFLIIRKIVTTHGALYISDNPTVILYALFGISLLLLTEIRREYLPEKYLFFENKNVFVRYMSYISVIALILLLGVFDGGQFIYFQF